jgi:hypothetical protein
MTYYELLETPPANCEPIARLWTWSENYNYPTPATLFLDITGYSEDELGERLCRDTMPAIGYLEAGMLGEALTAYADYPDTVMAYVRELLAGEANE